MGVHDTHQKGLESQVQNSHLNFSLGRWRQKDPEAQGNLWLYMEFKPSLLQEILSQKEKKEEEEEKEQFGIRGLRHNQQCLEWHNTAEREPSSQH